jgi:hypothetical protein
MQIAWYVEKPEIEPVRFGEWVGKVSSGMSSTNFNNILLIPMDMERTRNVWVISQVIFIASTNLLKIFLLLNWFR